jgi:PhnB protein
LAKTDAVSRRHFFASAVSAAAVAALLMRSTGSGQVQKTRGDDMTKLMPYLLFDGTCKEAMEFYQSCLGGELTLTKVKDTPAKDQMSAAQQEKVLNAHLSASQMEISASDWLAPNETPVRGNTVCLFLSGGTLQDLKTVFDKLAQGAHVTSPLKEVFFGVYGALNDMFGVRWVFQTNRLNG